MERIANEDIHKLEAIDKHCHVTLTPLCPYSNKAAEANRNRLSMKSPHRPYLRFGQDSQIVQSFQSPPEGTRSHR